MPAPDGDQLLFVLFTESLLIRDLTKSSEIRVTVPYSIPNPDLRDADGSMNFDSIFLAVRHDRNKCLLALDTYAFVRCTEVEGDWIRIRNETWGQIVGATEKCPDRLPILVTGRGDDTQQDFLRVVEKRDSSYATVSNQIDFAGPILAVNDDARGMARVIVRNLRTGNYEAYRLSISCGP
jgi:hypothetical protein